MEITFYQLAVNSLLGKILVSYEKEFSDSMLVVEVNQTIKSAEFYVDLYGDGKLNLELANCERIKEILGTSNLVIQ